ncbi:MAG: hypothetical protein A2580_14350 [Hydrogenophilales bacterium RIFOXYD1_FULL_62_11]|nr:MAG: hypothetical protein A2580_14350 [Hydrogenophilales bacterium RIFOXYD1_FULL_62_11]
MKEDSSFGDVISSYSRAQALEDGELVDVSKIAKEAGIKFPTAVTRNLFTKWIEPSAEDKKYGQDLQGRLWDVVYMFTVYAKRTSGSRMTYPVIFAKGKKHVTVKLLAIIGPGDTDAPTATIMLPEDE